MAKFKITDADKYNYVMPRGPECKEAQELLYRTFTKLQCHWELETDLAREQAIFNGMLKMMKALGYDYCKEGDSFRIWKEPER